MRAHNYPSRQPFPPALRSEDSLAAYRWVVEAKALLSASQFAPPSKYLDLGLNSHSGIQGRITSTYGWDGALSSISMNISSLQPGGLSSGTCTVKVAIRPSSICAHAM